MNKGLGGWLLSQYSPAQEIVQLDTVVCLS